MIYQFFDSQRLKWTGSGHLHERFFIFFFYFIKNGTYDFILNWCTYQVSQVISCVWILIRLKKRKGCKLGVSRWFQISENVKVEWWPHQLIICVSLSTTRERKLLDCLFWWENIYIKLQWSAWITDFVS